MRTGILLLTLASAGGVAHAEDVAAGKAIYDDQCAKCHGVNGDGKGRAGKALDPKPTDFTIAKFDDAYWIKIIKLGSKAVGKPNGMEPNPALSDQQIRDVIAFCKSFKH